MKTGQGGSHSLKVSTKGRYALRLMLDIAEHDQEEPVRVKDIAEREEISVKYLEHIVATLVRANYLTSIRGSRGGYRLTMTPDKYTVGMILRLTEGDMAPVACLENTPNECPRQGQCATLPLWKKLDEAIRGVIDRYTLADLAAWQDANDNYVI